jgi:ubiquitin-protein ligase
MIQFNKRRIEQELKNKYVYFIDGNELYFTYQDTPIRVEVTDAYPFLPPRVYIGGQLVRYSCSDYPTSEWQAYEKQYNNIATSTILYKENWTPVLGIISIVEEYFQFRDKMEKVRTQLLLEKHTTLPADIIYEIVNFL